MPCNVLITLNASHEFQLIDVFHDKYRRPLLYYQSISSHEDQNFALYLQGATRMLHVRFTDLYLAFEKGFFWMLFGRLAEYLQWVTCTLDAPLIPVAPVSHGTATRRDQARGRQ